MRSFPRRREGGLTFEVQQLREDLGWGLEVQTLTRGVVVSLRKIDELAWGEVVEIGFARQEASHAADGVLDAAFLPGGVGIAEESLDVEPIAQPVMGGELGSVIEGDGLAQIRWQGLQPSLQGVGQRPRLFGGLTDDGHEARGAFMQGEQDLAVDGEGDQVAFPVAGLLAVGNGRGTPCDGDAVLDVFGR